MDNRIWTILRPRFRFQAAIEAAALGLLFGLIDVHSKNGDFFDSGSAYFIAGLALGLRHAGRAWQAWIPLGSGLYVMHRAAIAYGYRPPYVEEDVNFAGQCLLMVWPVSLALIVGASLRFAVSCLLRITLRKTEGANPVVLQTGNRAMAPQSDPRHAIERDSVTAALEPPPRRRLTVGRLMVIVAVLGIHLAFVRLLLKNDPFFGFGTVYSSGYSESRFGTLRAGMTHEEVEAIVGPPFCKVAWDQPTNPLDREMWYYSNHHIYTANFRRRWVLFEKGKVLEVINDFWVD